MSTHLVKNGSITSDEPIYCNLIESDNDFGLDSRLEKLRVSATINCNNAINSSVGDTASFNHHSQQQQNLNCHHCTGHPQSSQPQQHQNQLSSSTNTSNTSHLSHRSNSVHHQQQSQQQPISVQSTPSHHLSLRSNLLRTIEEIDIDHDLITPTKDFDSIGDHSYNSRQLEAQFSPNNLRFQSYKYLTQSWPEGSSSKMLDSPLGRKVYHVAAEQTKTLSPPKEKCVKNYGRVKSWASSFDNLLKDPIGIKIYSRFLSREFSDENILFWIACEKYKKLIKKTEARKEAKAIYEQYLSINGSHTVNVDAEARNSVSKSLSKPTKELFAIPQTQVYNLMKNDSYKRFLTSELYLMCLESEKTGKPLPVCSKDDSDKKKVPSSSKRRLSLGSWVLKKTFRI